MVGVTAELPLLSVTEIVLPTGQLSKTSVERVYELTCNGVPAGRSSSQVYGELWTTGVSSTLTTISVSAHSKLLSGHLQRKNWRHQLLP